MNDLIIFKNYYKGGKKIIPFVIVFLPRAGYNSWYAGETLDVLYLYGSA